MGARTVLDGDRLYADLWDLKSPLIYIVYTIPLAIVGTAEAGYRAFDLLNTLVVVGALFLLGRRFFSDRAGVIAGALYAFAYLTTAQLDGLGQTESFMAAPLILAYAVYPFRNDDQHADRRAVAAGLLLGIVVALKFSALPLLLGLPALEFIRRRDADWTPAAALRRLVLSGAGIVAVQLVWIGYLALSGALSAFIDIQENFTRPYQDFRWSPAELPYWRFIVDGTSDWLTSVAFLSIPAWAALLIGLTRGPRRAVLFLATLALLGFVSVWWQGKMFRYHWLIVLPLLAPLAGYAIDQALVQVDRLSRRERLAGYTALAIGFVVFAMGPLLYAYDGYGLLLDRITGDKTASEVEARYVVERPANHEVVDYIRAEGSADDSFFVWGFWTIPHFLEERPLPSRFVTNAGLRATWAPAKWRRELIEDLEAARPRFIIVAAGDRQPWLVGTSQTSDEFYCNDFPALRSFVEDSYEPVVNNGLFTLYDREASEASAPGRCPS
jgi:4-amino-4-deoxy-L-arabinose transferase-like glycosyltransferase